MNPTHRLHDASRWLQGWAPLRRLDRVPYGRATALGAALGLGLAAALALGQLPFPATEGLLLLIAVAGSLVALSSPVVVERRLEEEEETVASRLLDMVEIPAGAFLMGSPEDEPGRLSNEVQHRVQVSAFEIGRTTVTREQYQAVMEAEPPGSGSGEHPVTRVSWLDAATFCNRLSEQEGLPPCYQIDGDTVTWIADDGGYRLPTEAEWEVAARAGTTTPWCSGSYSWWLRRYAWFSVNSGGHTHEVRKKRANRWGLYDMHGNVRPPRPVGTDDSSVALQCRVDPPPGAEAPGYHQPSFGRGPPPTGEGKRPLRPAGAQPQKQAGRLRSQRVAPRQAHPIQRRSYAG